MKNILNILFDKVFIITIERNSSRLETFIKQNKDLEIEIFKGIDGKKLFPELEFVHQFPDAFFKENSLNYEVCKSWNKSQLGCAMSNRHVQKEIVKRGLTNALILEDDAHILSDIEMVLTKATQELPTNWDLLYLGYNPISRWAEYSYLKYFVILKHFLFPRIFENLVTNKKGKNIFPKSYSRNLNIPGIYIGTHAYAVSLVGVKKLLEIDNPLRYGADRLLMYSNFHKKINAYSTKKSLINQNSLFSSSIQ
jgi:GR25 family glycosyltransferase involved in LPS biosynthesis